MCRLRWGMWSCRSSLPSFATHVSTFMQVAISKKYEEISEWYTH
jgi:hypothetical protein